ncbi:hypothetical protein M9Y10_021237 [Tritrichomonas musculus]|uniref:Uncharacterized protein n=1 Tax=Tritrichomonas musculus TaxID=1915356 RepID=A0ABR2HEB4_9EUKA
MEFDSIKYFAKLCASNKQVKDYMEDAKNNFNKREIEYLENLKKNIKDQGDDPQALTVKIYSEAKGVIDGFARYPDIIKEKMLVLAKEEEEIKNEINEKIDSYYKNYLQDFKCPDIEKFIYKLFDKEDREVKKAIILLYMNYNLLHAVRNAYLIKKYSSNEISNDKLFIEKHKNVTNLTKQIVIQYSELFSTLQGSSISISNNEDLDEPKEVIKCIRTINDALEKKLEEMDKADPKDRDISSTQNEHKEENLQESEENLQESEETENPSDKKGDQKKMKKRTSKTQCKKGKKDKKHITKKSSSKHKTPSDKKDDQKSSNNGKDDSTENDQDSEHQDDDSSNAGDNDDQTD